LLVAAVPSHAFPHHGFVRTRVFVGVGPVWWGAPYPYWYYPPPPVYVVPAPTPVVVEPPVYTQQPQVMAPAPPAPGPQNFWYYCPSAQGYYPSVPNCNEPWVKVAPRPQ